MTDRELMQQALDALEYASDETKPEGLHGCDCLICEAIPALRDRLAKPHIKVEGPLHVVCQCDKCKADATEGAEPVAWRYRGNLHEFDPSDWAEGPVTPLYTTPRPWVGLTDEDYETLSQYAFVEVIEKIEAVLKEKNT